MMEERVKADIWLVSGLFVMLFVLVGYVWVLSKLFGIVRVLDNIFALPIGFVLMFLVLLPFLWQYKKTLSLGDRVKKEKESIKDYPCQLTVIIALVFLIGLKLILG